MSGKVRTDSIAKVGAGVAIGIVVAWLIGTLLPFGGGTISVNSSPIATGDVVKVARALGPAVGTVVALESNGQDAIGSAFIIAHNRSVSYLLTNGHVVSGAKDLHVAMPNGETLSATLVGADNFDDLAVISIADPHLPVAQFAKSADAQVGETVVAIGSPLGNAGSITAGVISALHRTIKAGGTSGGSETLQDVLQTDASIDPGNSGGPLSDLAGRVIGVNVAFAGSASRIGYSIPSDVAAPVAHRLIKGEKVQHPYLGIGYLTAIDAVQAGHPFNGPGVLVSQVQTNSPATTAGIKVDDILVAVDGVALDNGVTLGGLIQTKSVGDSVSLTLSRNGSQMTVNAKLAPRPGE